MNTKIHASHVTLYVLYLLQTVATFMTYLIWSGSDIAMNFFCPSSLLVMLADTGVSLLQLTYGTAETITFTVECARTKGNVRIVLLDENLDIIHDFSVTEKSSYTVNNAKGKEFEKLELEERFKVRYIIKAFNRFYSYMAQIVRTFDVELYKTYIFTEILYKLIPKTPHEKVDLTGKLALEQHKFSEGFSGSIVLAPTVEDKTLENEKGGSSNAREEKRDLLGNIIEKINIMYQGNFTEADRVIVETIYDAIQKEGKKLTKQAKNSDVNMFAQNIFPKVFERIAQDCYVQQMDSFAKLFEEPSFYKRVMEEMARAMYFNLKNGE